ncbi:MULTISPECIES: hypothetical protein [Mycobacteriaceae]|uniref:Uncharacterized protein n=2 Tax=Mycobacteriaceae TaxID=1762 RepID=A0ACC6MIE4_MYCPF|nr:MULTISPECIES: hypothetical protein [Mycobacteriaceae]MDZ5086726.1 hypothetical protein [Mycolicibacterium parafortuitum]
MSMVVERGLARCPRCVSMADYVFIETVTDDASPVTRYEVRCRKCGECYGEESQPLTYPPVSGAVEPPIVWPRDQEPVPPRDWRQELRERVDRAGRVTTRVGKEAADTAERWGGHAAGRMRTWAGAVKDTLESTKHTLEEKVAARRRGEHEPDAPDENRLTAEEHGLRPETSADTQEAAANTMERPAVMPQKPAVTPEGAAASEVAGGDHTGG